MLAKVVGDASLRTEQSCYSKLSLTECLYSEGQCWIVLSDAVPKKRGGYLSIVCLCLSGSYDKWYVQTSLQLYVRHNWTSLCFWRVSRGFSYSARRSLVEWPFYAVEHVSLYMNSFNRVKSIYVSVCLWLKVCNISFRFKFQKFLEPIAVQNSAGKPIFLIYVQFSNAITDNAVLICSWL
jgi:hypothetical protein